MENLEKLKNCIDDIAKSNTVNSERNAEIVKNIQKNKQVSKLSNLYHSKRKELFLIAIICIVVAPLYQKYRGFHPVTFVMIEMCAITSFIQKFLQVCILNDLDFAEGVSDFKKKIDNYCSITNRFTIIIYIMAILTLCSVLYYDFVVSLLAMLILVAVVIICICVFALNNKEDKKEIIVLKEISNSKQ